MARGAYAHRIMLLKRLTSSLVVSAAAVATLSGCPSVVIGPGETGGGGGGTGACVTAADCEQKECAGVSCFNGGCLYDFFPTGAPCEDGLACTEGDFCQAGKCVSGGPAICSVGPCQIGVCDESQGGCVNTPAPDGTPCGGDDPCTAQPICIGGVCESGPMVDCSALNTACAVGVCEQGVGCVAQPINEGGLCDDGLFCTVGDHCKAGSCVGQNPCPEPGGCFVAACDEATKTCGQKPGNDGVACATNAPCLQNTVCSAGQCVGAPVPDGTPCDDGNVCTSNTTCTTGVCGGGVGPTLFFAEDFHDNSQGWILGSEWEIDQAQVSPPGTFGSDPANDHSPSADNGIAGINIGGNASTMLHPFTYLESPPFNTTGGPGGVVLQFYRWLVSDYPPFMTNTVEIWNGTQWVILWQGAAGQSIIDNAWTLQQFNISQYQGPNTKIRFGMNVTSSGAFLVGSWNIDDILVSSAPCP